MRNTSSQRILFVNHNLSPFEISGTPLSTRNHVLGISKRGFEVAVLIPSDKVRYGYKKEQMAEGFTLYQVPAIDKIKAYLAGHNQIESSYIRLIEQIIDNFLPQIVHINDYVYMPAEIIEIFSSKGCIVVREVCNCEELCHKDSPVISHELNSHLCSGPDTPEKCYRCLISQASDCSHEVLSPKVFNIVFDQIKCRFEYIKRLYKDTINKVIFTSLPFKEYFTRFVPIPEEKARVIPRGFNFSFPRNIEKIKSVNSAVNFAFIGNVMFSKGIDVVLKAFEVISSEPNFSLHIYGHIINHEYRPWLEILQARYPLKFIYHGPFEESDLPQIAKSIDICIIPSYFDTYNRVLREFLYLGVPVIATDFFGAYIVEENKNGFKIPIGDSNSLAQKMIDLIHKPTAIESLSRGAQQTQIPDLKGEIDAMVEVYNDLYHQLSKSEKAQLDEKVRVSDMGKTSVDKTTKLIAFYLPQYHPIPENDHWWGKGFTEWTNVAKAKPLFSAHYQPHIPADLGFYDLRLPETREAQAHLAQQYGITGFCYYHYWFNGKRLLHRVFDEVMITGKPDFPFCLCWANENWTRSWDGGDKKILIGQQYSQEDDLKHITWLIRAFKDPRYIKIQGKPLLLIYRTSDLPDPGKTAALWKEEVQKNGFPDLYLCKVESFANEHTDPHDLGFDAAVEFQPDWSRLGEESNRHPGLHVFNYSDVVENMIKKSEPRYQRFPCVTPSWDNSPRRGQDGVIFHDSQPFLYEKWLRHAVSKVRRKPSDERIVFINAWNEWGEGNHLEPDQRNGHAYLHATKRALTVTTEKSELLDTLIGKAEAAVDQACWGEAESLLLKALDHDPSSPRTLHQYAILLFHQGRLDEAIETMRSTLEMEPGNAEFQNDIGSMYHASGNAEEAQKHFEKALEIHPEDNTSLKNLADLLIEKGEIKDALRICGKLKSICPGDQEVDRLMASVQRMIGYNAITGNKVTERSQYRSPFPDDPVIIKREVRPSENRKNLSNNMKPHTSCSLSIILSAKNKLQFTRHNIQLILDEIKNLDAELIVVDNGSDDGSRDFLNHLHHECLSVILLGSGTTDVRGAILGAERTSGKHLMFLDSSALVTKPLLQSVISALGNTAGWDAITGKTVSNRKTIIEAGTTAITESGLESRGVGKHFFDPAFNFTCQVESGSRYFTVLRREVWDEVQAFNPGLEDIGAALLDIGLRMASMGYRILYKPQCILLGSIAAVSQPEISDSLLPDTEILGSLRPEDFQPDMMKITSETGRKNILVLGIYLANKMNTVNDIVTVFYGSGIHTVVQKWIALNGSPPNAEVAAVTEKILTGKVPKFQILNDLLHDTNISQYDYIILCDDDVILPRNFVDSFIAMQSRLEFAIAQPARTLNSYTDHPIVQQHIGVHARQTHFVEIGPVVSFHRSAFDLIFPFDLTSPMGWGYENVWAHEVIRRGMKMGIIDAICVDHSLRKPVANYDWSQADRERNVFLQKHEHLPLEECFRVVKAHVIGEVAA